MMEDENLKQSLHLWTRTLKEITYFIWSQMSKKHAHTWNDAYDVSHTYGAQLTSEVLVVRQDEMHCLTNVTVKYQLKPHQYILF